MALRPSQDGSISGYSGVDELQQQYGEWVIDAHLPPPGTPTQGVEAGYMANAYVRMRHPDYDTLRGMLDAVGRTPARLRLVRIVLLGPQRRPTLEGVARSLGLGLAGPVATITAGWQEREPDDAELAALLGGPARSTWRCTGGGWTCGTAIRSTAPGSSELAGVLAELQELYLLRLDYALQAVYAVQRRPARPRLPVTRWARRWRRSASWTRRTCAG